MKKLICIWISIISVTTLFSQASIQKQPLTVDLIWGSATFYEKQPLSITQLNDQTHYLLLERNKNVTEINKYSINNPGKKISTLISSNQDMSIDDFKVSPDEKSLIIFYNSNVIFRHSYTADAIIINLESKEISPIAEKLSAKRDFKFAPNGKSIFFSNDNDLYQYIFESKKTIQLTKTGKKNSIINGTADWVYEEEFSKTDFYEISADSKFLSYVRFEQNDVPPTILNYYNGNSYTDYETLKYPKVGAKNSVVTLYMIDLISKKETKINLDSYEYIPRIQFSPYQNTLIIQTLNRKQDHLVFYKIDCNSKAITTKKLCEEKDTKYIEIEDQLIFLPNKTSFITLSDRSGYKHIHRFNFDGTTKQLTSGNYDIQQLHGYTPNNEILFTAAYQSAINSSIHTVDFEGANFKTLSEINIKNDVASYANGQTYYYGYYTDVNTPKTIAFFDLLGNVISIQEDNKKLATELGAFHLSPKEFIKIKGVEDSLNVSIIRPTNFDASKKYPVYFHVYAGPGSNTVKNQYGGPEYAYHQLLAQQGYFVISVDPRGTLYRGADFKKSTYGKLGSNELDDIVAVAKEISNWNYIDKERIGIQGWSFGGFMASLAITKASDIFKMAIAVAPVTDWRYYDNVYTERYMNLLETNVEGYQKNSPIYYADNLKGSYLLIHGDADDNVHIQNAMELAKALINKNKDFDYFIYPNKNHGIGGVRKHLYNKMLKFTLSSL